MATKTRADLVRRVLDKLQMTQTGQNPAPEDVTQVDTSLDTALATLASDEIVYIADPDKIDPAYFDPLAVCVADKMALDFGAAISAEAVFVAQTVLRRIQRLKPLFVEQTTSYI